MTTEAEFNKYLQEHFEPTLKWYDSKAITSQRCYFILSAYMVIASILIVVLSFIENFKYLVPILMAPSLAIATGLLSLFQPYKNWKSYRATWDALKREKRLRDAVAGNYKIAKDANALFVERIEKILQEESSEWYERVNEFKNE